MSIAKLRNVEIEDLLGRDPIRVNLDEIMGYVSGKVVLVTGGGGSIGSELCRQVASHNPKQLIIFDIYENNAYDIQLELKEKYPDGADEHHQVQVRILLLKLQLDVVGVVLIDIKDN